MDKKIEIQSETFPAIHPLTAVSDILSLRRSAIIILLVAAAGALTGFLLSVGKETVISSISSIKKGKAPAKAKRAVGIKDKKTFKDSAEGKLKEGGIDGEGQFHLERPGGASQNVYLTSTTVDLSEFIGKKVRVWGETFAAEKAGWLMDVGLVEIL